MSVEDQSEEGSFYRSKRFKRSGEAALWFRHLADTPCHVTNLPRNSIPTASGDNYRPRCWTLAHHRAVPGHLFALFHRTGDSPPCSFSANHRAPFLPAFFLSIHAAPFIPPSFFPPFPLPPSLLLSSLCTSYLLFFQCLALIRAFTSILALFSSFFLLFFFHRLLRSLISWFSQRFVFFSLRPILAFNSLSLSFSCSIRSCICELTDRSRIKDEGKAGGVERELKIKGRIVRSDSSTSFTFHAHSFAVLLLILPSSSLDLYPLPIHFLFHFFLAHFLAGYIPFCRRASRFSSPNSSLFIRGARGRAPVWIIISSHGRTAQLVIKIFRSPEWYYPR